jgi:hypothetical protein
MWIIIKGLTKKTLNENIVPFKQTASVFNLLIKLVRVNMI